MPGWVVVCAVVGIFLFQTLDNLDGRQVFIYLFIYLFFLLLFFFGGGGGGEVI